MRKLPSVGPLLDPSDEVNGTSRTVCFKAMKKRLDGVATRQG